jgi:hypothetical protein
VSPLLNDVFWGGFYTVYGEFAELINLSVKRQLEWPSRKNYLIIHIKKLLAIMKLCLYLKKQHLPESGFNATTFEID